MKQSGYSWLSVALASFGVSACDPAPAEVTTPLADQIPITVGEAYFTPAGVRVPIGIMNLTGEDQPFVKVTCSLFSKEGGLIESVDRVWLDVPQDRFISGELLPDSETVGGMQCVPSLG